MHCKLNLRAKLTASWLVSPLQLKQSEREQASASSNLRKMYLIKMKQYKQARKSAECYWGQQVPVCRSQCLSEQWILSAWDKAWGQSPGESPASNPSAHSWSSGCDITKSHSEEPKPSVPSYISGNEHHKNVILHFPQYSNNNWADPARASTPKLLLYWFCILLPPVLHRFSPYVSWEIISIIPAVVLHHMEHNQS